MIRTSDDTFYIQPLPSNVVRNNGFKHGHPHVIYRRSIEVEVSSDYHVSGNKHRLNAMNRSLTFHLIITLKMTSTQELAIAGFHCHVIKK